MVACLVSLSVASRIGMTIEQKKLISHSVSAPQTTHLKTIAERITAFGDKPHVTVRRQLELLEKLNQFDFGRFLLHHQGINGYWTHYMLVHPWQPHKQMSDLEQFILERAPIMRATQERFEIFLAENQKQVKAGAELACIPCGMMGELLYLEFNEVEGITLTGIDYDPETLIDAQLLAEQQHLSASIDLQQADGWALNEIEKFDLISSNGLTIYEPNEEKITALYQIFFKALKPGGKLVTSFLTAPPGISEQCEWDMTQINLEDLMLQKIIFADIIEAKWQCYRSTAQIKNQLESVGFTAIEFIYDKARIFPTVVGYKQE